MKKKILLLLPTVFLCLVSAYIALASSISFEGSGSENRAYLLIPFLLSIFLNLLYYLWLSKTKRLGTKLTVFYIPIALILFVVFFFSIFFVIMRPPWRKIVRYDLGPDPLYEGANMVTAGIFSIWEKEFWSKRAQEEYRLKVILKEMQTAKQVDLITSPGTDLQGWSDEKIKSVFGEPTKIIKVDESLEKWIYHPRPQTNNPDLEMWEVPVYVLNGALLKIGYSKYTKSVSYTHLTLPTTPYV